MRLREADLWDRNPCGICLGPPKAGSSAGSWETEGARGRGFSCFSSRSPRAAGSLVHLTQEHGPWDGGSNSSFRVEQPWVGPSFAQVSASLAPGGGVGLCATGRWEVLKKHPSWRASFGEVKEGTNVTQRGGDSQDLSPIPEDRPSHAPGSWPLPAAQLGGDLARV